MKYTLSPIFMLIALFTALMGRLGRFALDTGLVMANAPMRSTDFRAVVEPILNEVFDGIYDQRSDEWKGAFKERTGTPRNFHEEPVLYGFGAAPEVPDGESITFSQGGTLFIQRYVYSVFGLAFSLTRVLVEDGDHIRIGKIFSEHLAQSMIETKETLGAQILNRAFNAGYVGGDGSALCVSNHPIIGNTASNVLATPAVLSQTSAEQLCIQMRGAVDNNGKKIRIIPSHFVVPPQLEFQAEVIQKSVLRSGTMNNDLNPIRSKGLIKGETAVLSRLTSSTAWWIHAGGEVTRGLQMMKRRGLVKAMEGDFDTDSMKYKATERYIPSWTDWRDLWGTPGV